MVNCVLGVTDTVLRLSPLDDKPDFERVAAGLLADRSLAMAVLGLALKPGKDKPGLSLEIMTSKRGVLEFMLQHVGCPDNLKVAFHPTSQKPQVPPENESGDSANAA